MNMSDKFTKEDLLLEQWKAAIELHKHEDILSWNKFSYFTTMNATLLGAIAYLWSNKNTLDFVVLGLLVSIFGFVVSIAWFLAQERGRMYQKYWIDRAKESEWLLLAQGESNPTLMLYSQRLEGKYPDMRFWTKASTHIVIAVLSLCMSTVWFIFCGYVILIF